MSKTEEIKSILGPLRVFENESLSKHTYFEIGGPAKVFFEAKSIEDLKLALKAAKKVKIPVVVIGGGANVLVSDSGFDGLVIKNRATGVKLVGLKGTYSKHGRGIKTAFVYAASGTLMNQLARFTLDQGLAGLEFLLSVPGTVGGGIKINAHFEVEQGEFLGSRLASATLFNPKTAEITEVDQKYFNFSYDHSKIQETGEIVLDAIFKLGKSPDPVNLWQKALANVKRRNEEQPIGTACSGCVFRNIDAGDANRLATPNLTTSAGFIIDSLGLKGTKIGGAEISNHHANFIVNRGNASANDVIKLINLVKEKTKNTYGIDLHTEIFLIGDFKNV